MIDIENNLQKKDEELVRLSLDNQNYFTFIIKKYENKLLSYILRISNVSREEAEDLLQEIFIKVYKNLYGFDNSLKFSSWIYRIAHNQVISNYRKLQARPKQQNFDYGSDEIGRIASDLDIAQAADKEYLQKNVRKVIESIDKKYQEVLVLKYLEDMSYQEISDIIKKPLGTVATLLNRAKQKFREELLKQNINF